MRLQPVPITLLLVLAAPLAAAEDALPAPDFGTAYGRYAPAGDCKREPQIVVEAAGFTITAAGRSETLRNPEVAWSYGGNYYEGISRWVFPYGSGEHPVIMTFNHDEKPGMLAIEPHDHGWKGGPPLSPKHRALVSGSPYRKCR